MKCHTILAAILSFVIVTAVGNATALADGAGSGGSGDPWDNAPAKLVEPLKLIDAEDFSAAITALNTALEEDTQDPDVLNLLGFSHRQLGEYDTALGFYEQALASDPRHKGALEYLGELYLQTDQLEMAEKQLDALSDICTFCKERKILRKAIKKYKRKNS